MTDPAESAGGAVQVGTPLDEMVLAKVPAEQTPPGVMPLSLVTVISPSVTLDRVASPDIVTGERAVMEDATSNCPAPVGAVEEPVPPFAIDSGVVAVASGPTATPLSLVTVSA